MKTAYFTHALNAFIRFWHTALARRIGVGFVGLFSVFVVLHRLFPLPSPPPYSTLVVDSQDNILYAFLSDDDKWRMMTEQREITPELTEALIYKEDRFFYWHLGINPISIARATANNLRYRKRTSGASTITMQVARLLEPKRRTYANKIVEIFRALQLEWAYSKAEILQLYLNLVPYGGNIEGVKSAAMLYFKKTPEQLSLAEITALTIIPNRPNSLIPTGNNPDLLAARQYWLRRFGQANLFDAKTIADALEEPLTAQRGEAPKIAPQFAYRLKNAYPNQPIIKTALQLNKQLAAEQLVRNYNKQCVLNGIKNAAVLVVNNFTGAVEAYVGSADFYNTQDGGQVDGIRAVRSPGSTLKPLIYALAFDKGVITPKQKIPDVPTSFNGYAPINYEDKFDGMVTAEDALARSLNVPAVYLLDQIGVDELAISLSNCGFSRIAADHSRHRLGLSLALGGCGTRLEELTNLYVAFANKGRYRPLQWLRSAADTARTPIISTAAAYMLYETLTQLTRPDFPENIDNSRNLPRVAWKTGTSYGRKDAWSIGYNARYTIGVWVGNFSGEGVSELSGAFTATPLLFQLFNTLDYQATGEWFVAPPDLSLRWVCAESGLPPNDFCTQQVMDNYIPLVSTSATCQHLARQYIAPDSSTSYCKFCLPEAGYKQTYYPNLPPAIISYYEQQKIPYQKIPPHNPSCDHLFIAGNAPRIVSPLQGLTYWIDRSDNTQLALQCQVEGNVEKVFWYVNGDFLQSMSPSSSLFFVPQKGENTITCTDDKGRSTTIDIMVNFI